MKAQHKHQRVGVFIDVQNMYYSAKHLYTSKVNFKGILKEAVKDRKLIRAFAYVIKADDKESTFFGALEEMGIEIRAKELQVFYGGAKKGDWDVGIAMDIMRLANKLDVIALVSGDGDFKDLLEHVGALGCRTEVFAFGRSASSRLKETTDLFVDLDKEKSKYLIKGGMRRSRPSTTQSTVSRSTTETKPASSMTGPPKIPTSTTKKAEPVKTTVSETKKEPAKKMTGPPKIATGTTKKIALPGKDV